MYASDRRTGIEVIHRDECLALAATQPVGRLAVVDHGRPHVVPVNFVLDGEDVVFRSFPGTKVDRLLDGPVCFEVDDVDAATRTGWSVVIHGRGEEVTRWDPAERRERLERLGVDPWAEGEKPHLVRIVAATVTGRRVRGHG